MPMDEEKKIHKQFSQLFTALIDLGMDWQNRKN